ncbi:hypothetical protein H650_09600 [Enterobacter sp. R4-368]|nr:hypothetical protein H650_09600 [Enterobacter sp. R4-368]
MTKQIRKDDPALPRLQTNAETAQFFLIPAAISARLKE